MVASVFIPCRWWCLLVVRPQSGGDFFIISLYQHLMEKKKKLINKNINDHFYSCGDLCVSLRDLTNNIVFKFWRWFLFNHILLSQILWCLVTLTSASTTPSTHECIVYIEAAMAEPGAEPIPHKLVCATDDGSRRSITLLGDSNEFFSGRVLSGVYRLTIPTTLISVDDTIDLDGPASDYIEIEEKPESRATYTGTFKVLVVRVHDGTGAGHTYSAAQLATNVFTTATGELSLVSWAHIILGSARRINLFTHNCCEYYWYCYTSS